MYKTLPIILFVILFSACKTGKKDTLLDSPQLLQSDPSPSTFDYTNFALKEGDLLFQDNDCGPFCASIEKVTTGIQGAKFSHIGMVVPTEKRGLMVVEAITKGVVLTPLDSFFLRSFDDQQNSKVVVGRMKVDYQDLISKAIDFAKSKMGIPYDDVFDIYNDQYYCSELIYDAFKFANDNVAVFQLQPMTYIDPETNLTFPVWVDYFDQLKVPIPEGNPGLNPGGISRSSYLEIVHFYGKPDGYTGTGHLEVKEN